MALMLICMQNETISRIYFFEIAVLIDLSNNNIFVQFKIVKS